MDFVLKKWLKNNQFFPADFDIILIKKSAGKVL